MGILGGFLQLYHSFILTSSQVKLMLLACAILSSSVSQMRLVSISHSRIKLEQLKTDSDYSYIDKLGPNYSLKQLKYSKSQVISLCTLGGAYHKSIESVYVLVA